MVLPHHEMIFVQGGTFTQGDREVTLSDFEMGRYPVTQALWEAVMGNTNNKSFFRGPRHPVDRIGWYFAIDFCNKLNKIRNLQPCYFFDDNCTQPYFVDIDENPPGNSNRYNAGEVYYKPTSKSFRLPTAEEWEYAAKGGKYHCEVKYAGSDRLKDVAWFADNSSDESQPVGLLQPNALGMYDLCGNIDEWCWNDFERNTLDTTALNATSANKMLKGGSWISYDKHCQISSQFSNSPFNRSYNYFGFRLARHLTLTPPPPHPETTRRRSPPRPCPQG